MPEIQSGGYVTHYADDDFTDPWKPRPTILIQHGFARNERFWYPWVPLLARDFRVIRRDLRGHGGSGDGGADLPWHFDTLVDDLAGFIETLQLDQVHLLGESTGGMLAVGLAARHPARLRSLTLCSSPTTIPPAAQTFFAAGYKTWATAIRTLGSEGWARWLLAQPGTAPPGDPARTAWAIKEMGRSTVEGLVGYSGVISATDTTNLLAQVAVPTLVLAPTHSAATSMADQERIAAAIPQAALVRIDGAAHEIYVDRAAECVQALRHFIACVG